MKKKAPDLANAKEVIQITCGKVEGTLLSDYTRIFLIPKEADEAQVNVIYSQASAYQRALWRDKGRINWVVCMWLPTNPL